MKVNKKIVIVGGGVTGANLALELVDKGYPGNLITVIDKGNNPYSRKPEEIMEGWLGSGAWSDGKLTRHTQVGGKLSAYCGENKAYELIDKVISNFKKFHPQPDKIQYSAPKKEPEFIKPYFKLRLHPVYHIGTNFLHQIAVSWYEYLVSKGVNFMWKTEIEDIDFNTQLILDNKMNGIYYDELVYATGKAGIDLTQKLIDKYNLPSEGKNVQIGVRFESPQHHFQKIIDVAYDFKLYKKIEEDQTSIRSFCSNAHAAYVAVEETYGNYSFNGHAEKEKRYENQMVNFGIMMEIKGIKDPFNWARDKIQKLQKDGKGLFYSPYYTRVPSKTSEGKLIECHLLNNLDILYEVLGKYAFYIEDYIEDLKKVFPTLQNDWGIYIPEVKYLSNEVIVNYEDLSLIDYPNVHFGGDSLSSRGLSGSGGQGIIIAEGILKKLGY